MFKLVESETENIIPMGKMQPLDIAVIVNGSFINEIVMRTASSGNFEVMQLSHPCPDRYWSAPDGKLNVRILPPGTKITLEVI